MPAHGDGQFERSIKLAEKSTETPTRRSRETAGVAFCREGRRPTDASRHALTVVEDGFGYQATMVDCALPVEVYRDDLGQVMSARMCFTDDVDVLDGTWREIGRLTLADGHCEASDPDCDGPAYR
jgi:hypothetical protein